MKLEINNLTRIKIDEKKIRKVFYKVAEFLKLKNKLVSLAFISIKESQRLNRIYRGKNKVTDILSFNFEEIKNGNFVEFLEKEKFLGEIIICPQKLKIIAKKDKIYFEKEVEKFFIHGLLHLLGYDHEKTEREALKMEKLEKNILEIIN